MKNFIKFLFVILLIPVCVISQSNSFKYQAVLHDNQGNLITNEQVSIRINILAGSTDGPPLYTEEHTVTTNNHGLVFFNIGEGLIQSGDFNSIVWGSDNHDLQVELDRNNNGYVSMGITPLLSVPYAMHAQTVENTDDADADPANEIQHITISNDTIYLSEGGAVKLPNSATGFSGSFNDLEDVPANLDTDSTDDFSGDYNDLTGTPPLAAVATSGSYTDLENQPTLGGDATGSLDAVSVEKIQGQNVSAGSPASGQVLKWNGSAWAPGTDATLSGGGVDGVVESISVTGTALKTITLGLSADAASSSLTADFDDEVDDADANPTNEIQDLSLAANILTITNNGTATDIDLSAYLDNTDTQLTETEVDNFVNNNGYLTSFTEVDGSVSNEIQQISISGDTIKLNNGGGEVKLPAKVLGSDGADVLFCVVNNNDDTVFAVYESGVRIYVEDGVTKAARGGFAVATRSAVKGETLDVLNVNGDSVRIYLEESTGKAARGGFAVATRSASKGTITGDILSISDDSVRIYLEEDIGKAARGGFAVATRSAAKGVISNVLTVTEDSTRIYIGDADAGFGVENTSSGSNERLMRLTEENYFIGHRTGINMQPAGLYNSFFGYEAGQINTTGSYNIFIGYQTGQTNSFGQWNTFMGYQAGQTNTGSDNTFIGYKAGNLHQSQGGNVYIGSKAGENATSGEQNVLIGESAGSNMTTASKNNFIGFQAGYSTSYGSRNVFMGNNSGYSNFQGSNNIFLGDSAGYGNTNGYKNVYIGTLAGKIDKFGNQNVYIGDEAGKNAEGQYNTFVGYQAGLNDNQFSNSYFGKSAGAGNVNGYRNTYLGSQAGQNTYEGNENTFIGSASGYSQKYGDGNVIIGNSAAKVDSASSYNLIIGNSAASYPNWAGGNQNLGDYNVILGSSAGYNSTFGSNVGTQNVFIGSNSGRQATGNTNVFIGYYSGYGKTGSNLLCIENSYGNRDNALIDGNFGTRTLNINGTFTFNSGTNSVTLPTNRGTTDYVLSTDGSGGTSWVSNVKASTVKSFSDRNVLEEIVQNAPVSKKENIEELDAASLPEGLQNEENLVNIDDLAAYNHKVNYEQQIVINELMKKLEELSAELNKLSSENKELKQLLNN